MYPEIALRKLFQLQLHHNEGIMNTSSKCRLLFIALIVILGNASNAQERSYVVSPANTIIESAKQDEEFVKFYIYQENKTNGNLVLGWNRLFADIPAGWDYSLCDLGTCYPGIPEGEHTMAPASVGEKAFLAMNIYPYGILGTANIQILVWDINNPSIVDTLTWVITITPTADVKGPSSKLSKILVYPNPSNDRAVIRFGNTASGSLILVNELGIEVLRTSVVNADEAVIDVARLSAGIYTTTFTSTEGIVSRTTIVKQ